jgi:hypothetical protein
MHWSTTPEGLHCSVAPSHPSCKAAVAGHPAHLILACVVEKGMRCCKRICRKGCVVALEQHRCRSECSRCLSSRVGGAIGGVSEEGTARCHSAVLSHRHRLCPAVALPVLWYSSDLQRPSWSCPVNIWSCLCTYLLMVVQRGPHHRHKLVPCAPHVRAGTICSRDMSLRQPVRTPSHLTLTPVQHALPIKCHALI